MPAEHSGDAQRALDVGCITWLYSLLSDRGLSVAHWAIGTDERLFSLDVILSDNETRKGEGS
jgi:hypothetical protein